MASRRGSASHPISAPNFESNHIHRPRLVNRLMQANGARVALVVASAGYGKTTLLSDFNRLSPDPVCWLRLSEADRDLLTLAGLVWASLERRFYRLKGDLDVNRMEGLAPRAIARRIAGATAEKVGERFALVIEDLHLLEGEAQVLEFVQALVDELPQNVFLLLSSRRVPDLKLVDLIAGDQVLTIGAEELAFDREELRDLVDLRLEEEPDEELLTALMNDTGGWVTGVLLSERLLDPNALPLNGRSEPMSFEYLADNAFERVSAELQDFMLRAAILPYMTAPICDELLEREDSEAFLEELVSRGLFTSVTLNNPRTYEYHHALSQFLRARAAAQLSEDDRSSLALKAAEILEAESQEYSALKILLEAGHEGEAVELADKHTKELYYWAPSSRLAQIGSMLQDSGVQAPLIFARVASSYGTSVGPREREFWLELAMNSLSAGDEQCKWYVWGLEAIQAEGLGDRKRLANAVEKLHQMGSPQTIGQIGDLARAESAYEMMNAQWGQAIETLRCAIDDMIRCGGPLPIREWSVRDRSSLGRITGCLAVNYVRVGELSKAREILEEEARIVGEDASTRLRAILLNNLACTFHYQGEYRKSVETFAEAISMATELEIGDLLGLLHLGYADVHADLGFSEMAEKHYRIAASYSDSIRDRHLRAQIDGNARVLRYRDASVKLAWLGDTSVDAPSTQDELNSAILTNFITRLDLTGDPARTLAELIETERQETRLNSLERTLLAMWKTLLHLRNGDLASAGRSFIDALSLANDLEMWQIVAAYLRFEERDIVEYLFSSAGGHIAIAHVKDLMIRMDHFFDSHTLEFDQTELEAEVVLRVFGDSQLLINGLPVSLRPLHLDILAFLAMKQEASNAEIGHVFWPNADRQAVSARLYSAVYEIRQAIGQDLISSMRGRYRLDTSKVVTDASEFLISARRALDGDRSSIERQILLNTAQNLYRGEFLPDCALEWAHKYRRECEDLYTELLQARARSSFGDGDYRQALADLRVLLDLDPFRDSAHTLYLRCLDALGKRGELVGHYRRSLSLYHSELQIDLPDQIVQTYRSLVR